MSETTVFGVYYVNIKARNQRSSSNEGTSCLDTDVCEWLTRSKLDGQNGKKVKENGVRREREWDLENGR